MARFLIDANLPRHAGVLAGGDCEFVIDIDPALKDIDIWKYASAHRLTIVSKDADFTHLLLADEAGPSVIQMRIGNMKFRDLESFLAHTWNDICDLSGRHRLVQVFLNRIEAVS
jgi:predicted nuclease of predicted toxin-antitoxin system